MRRAVEQMGEAARAIAGDLHGHGAAPPPLILCAADAHLGRPSLDQLLGSAGLLPPVGGAVRAAEELLEGVEVMGLYFAASWCAAHTPTVHPYTYHAPMHPCTYTTPLQVRGVRPDHSAARPSLRRAACTWQAARDDLGAAGEGRGGAGRVPRCDAMAKPRLGQQPACLPRSAIRRHLHTHPGAAISRG